MNERGVEEESGEAGQTDGTIGREFTLFLRAVSGRGTGRATRLVFLCDHSRSV